MNIEKELEKVKRNAKGTVKDVKRWTKKHKKVVKTGGYVIVIAMAGVLIGYKIKGYLVEKSIEKTLELLNDKGIMYTIVKDDKTNTTTEVISVTMKEFERLVKGGLK